MSQDGIHRRLTIDNGKEIFETDTLVIYRNDGSKQDDGWVAVSSTGLSAAEKYTSKFKDGSTSHSDYIVEINRISGDFREMTNERYTERAAFKIETKGNCKKVQNKF